MPLRTSSLPILAHYVAAMPVRLSAARHCPTITPSRSKPSLSSEPIENALRHKLPRPYVSDRFNLGRGQTFTCTPTHIWDADSPNWCAEGPRIRLAGIAAREIDGTCRPGKPCPRGSAIEARDRLVELIGRPIGRSREG